MLVCWGSVILHQIAVVGEHVKVFRSALYQISVVWIGGVWLSWSSGYAQKSCMIHVLA